MLFISYLASYKMDKDKVMGNKCIICSDSRRTNPDIRFFHFPKDKKILHLWLSACNVAEGAVVKNILVCGKHFSPKHMHSVKLKKNAYPTKFLVPPKKKEKKDENPTKNLNPQSLKEEKNANPTEYLLPQPMREKKESNPTNFLVRPPIKEEYDCEYVITSEEAFEVIIPKSPQI